MHSEKPPFLPGNRPQHAFPARASVPGRRCTMERSLQTTRLLLTDPDSANAWGQRMGPTHGANARGRRTGPTHGADALVRRIGGCIGLCSHRSSTTRPLRKGSVTGRGAAAASIADSRPVDSRPVDSRPVDSEPAHSGCAATGFAGKAPADA